MWFQDGYWLLQFTEKEITDLNQPCARVFCRLTEKRKGLYGYTKKMILNRICMLLDMPVDESTKRESSFDHFFFEITR